MVSLDYPHKTDFIGLIESSLSKVCEFYRGKKGRIKAGSDTMDALRAAFSATGVKFKGAGFDRQTFLGGAIGFCAYDMVYDCWLDISPGKSPTPDAQFALTTRTVVFDHLTNETFIVITPFIPGAGDAKEIYNQALEDANKLASAIEAARPFALEKNKPLEINSN
ncbi:MAG: hypothetical protein QSU88_11090, partial [Candidatus Methanoperedens sp.]|nr:hypothetical protein [Candidatus Methanoperedens sp.]